MRESSLHNQQTDIADKIERAAKLFGGEKKSKIFSFGKDLTLTGSVEFMKPLIEHAEANGFTVTLGTIVGDERGGSCFQEAPPNLPIHRDHARITSNRAKSRAESQNDISELLDSFIVKEGGKKVGEMFASVTTGLSPADVLGTLSNTIENATTLPQKFKIQIKGKIKSAIEGTEVKM
jgi:hypothetical protein